MSVKYTDPDYARSRLTGTVVFLGNDPIYIESIYDDGSCLAFSLPEHKEKVECHITDLDLTPPELGYINYRRRGSYAVRVPQRQWKQGFRTPQMYLHDGGTRPSLSGKPIFNMIKNIYPIIYTAIEQVSNRECTGMAFSKRFSTSLIDPDDDRLNLCFRGRNVGYLERKFVENIQPKYLDGFEYLRELFEETMGNGNAKTM